MDNVTYQEWLTQSRPAASAAAVTPHDTNDLASETRMLYVGGAGAVKVDLVDTDAVTFAAVPAGTVLPIRVTRVYSTGTTATSIVALW